MKSSRFLKSLSHAVRGILFVWAHERNFRMQCCFGLLALLAAWLLSISCVDTMILFVVIFFVLVVEMINTSLEIFLDAVVPRLSSSVKQVKDIMAGATLVAAMLAVVVGTIIFWPGMLRFLAFVRHSGIL